MFSMSSRIESRLKSVVRERVNVEDTWPALLFLIFMSVHVLYNLHVLCQIHDVTYSTDL